MMMTGQLCDDSLAAKAAQRRPATTIVPLYFKVAAPDMT
jgi:hypothetical protein